MQIDLTKLQIQHNQTIAYLIVVQSGQIPSAII